MKRNVDTVTTVFICDSQETLRQAEQIAQNEINLDKVFVDTAIAFPDGVEQRWITDHRLGDYFDQVQVLKDNSSLTLIFYPKQNVKRYWKDLMVAIIGSIKSVAGVSVKSVSNSNMPKEKANENDIR